MGAGWIARCDIDSLVQDILNDLGDLDGRLDRDTVAAVGEQVRNWLLQTDSADDAANTIIDAMAATAKQAAAGDVAAICLMQAIAAQ